MKIRGYRGLRRIMKRWNVDTLALLVPPRPSSTSVDRFVLPREASRRFAACADGERRGVASTGSQATRII